MCARETVSFASELREPAVAAREGLDSNEARRLARAFLNMSQAAFSARFKGSAMKLPLKRAKRRGLARNAAVVPGNVGTGDDVPALETVLEHEEPLVHERAAWALAALRLRPAGAAG